MSTKRLLEIKKQIDEAIPKQAEIAGQIKGVEEQMEQRFSVKPSEAEKKLDGIGQKIDDHEAEFKEGMETLEGAYGWD